MPLDSGASAGGQAVEQQRSMEEMSRSRAMLYQILNALPQSIFWKDTQSVYLGCNEVFARAVGLNDPAQVVGKTDFDLPWPKAEAEAYRRDDQEVLRSNRPKKNILEPLQQADGQRLWIDTTKVPLVDAQGRVYGVLGIYNDVTERRRTQMALEQSETRYRALFSRMQEGFSLHEIICDPDGVPIDYRFLDVNPTFERITGLPRERWIGRTIREVLPQIEPAWIERYGRVALTGIPATYEDYVKELDRFYTVLAYQPQPGQFAVISTDITERKRAEAERLALERQMLHTQKLESLGVLAGGIAHDFNNLLTTILGNASLAVCDLPPQHPVCENLREIEEAAQRAADLCRQMLAYAGRGRFVVETLHLNPLVEGMVHLLKASISKKVALSLALGEGLPPLRGDATQIRQIVMNLVVNASEALEGQNGAITVTTSLRHITGLESSQGVSEGSLAPGPYLSLEVADTGVGMDTGTLQRIFEPFFTTKFTGRGLGLSAVLGIVRGHQGNLRVQSEPGKGTIFQVLLPPAGQDASWQPEVSDSAAAWKGSGSVLLVDDEPGIRNLGRRMLERLGFQVYTAVDGAEAIRLYHEHRGEIRLVLLDLTMPNLNGEETFREIRRIDPQARVVLASGYSEMEVATRFEGQGIAGFVQKPYDFAKLQRQLQTVFLNGPHGSDPDE